MLNEKEYSLEQTQDKSKQQTTGEIILWLRISRNESMDDLAKILKTNKSVVSRWESGKTEPSLKHLKTLAKHYHVTIDFLAGIE